MNKKVIPVLILVILIAVAGYFLYSRNTKSNSAPTAANQTSTPETPSNLSIRDLLSLGQSQKCTFSVKDETSSSDSTIYISEGKFRGDFTTTSEGETNISHMLIDGTVSYIWTDGESQGFKMAYQAGSPGSLVAPPNSFDPDRPANYACSPWVFDQSVYSLPSGVTFLEFSVPAQ